MKVALSKSQQARDRQEAIEARRRAANVLASAKSLIDDAKKRLKYNKSYTIEIELTRIAGDLQEQIEILNDPEYDPD
ncbi:hypothetical protein SAMN02799624_05351 [Paenibacillus sp. UNC496MF]|uniref:hypothetical protein n=1 Tax=Paenibacillus sp. UNC496MF TaxID=1502753 RepID=UPI0008EF0721|nr:hypothetical protein [Paenibacillus sp. UNC496MF]SFJ64590.1 hypothetical protein SAMN02799624_05351 [Paenibacillus sp. UNC496MF]